MIKYFKIMLIGEIGSGKTKIMDRYLFDYFSPTYDPVDFEDYFAKTIMVDRVFINLRFYKSPDLEGYQFFNDLNIKFFDAFIIIHPIVSHDLIDKVDNHINLIYQLEKKEEYIPIIIAGSKSDLENEREVNKGDIEDYYLNKGIKYIEFSSKTGNNVTNLIQTIVIDILNHQKEIIGIETRKHRSKEKKCNVV